MRASHILAAVVALASLAACSGRSSSSRGRPFFQQPPPVANVPPPAGPLGPPGAAPKGRLPTDVRPTHYTLVLEVVPERERFAGVVEIAVDVAAPRDLIWLHGKGI